MSSALGFWGLSRIPHPGQLLLHWGTKAGALKAPNISSPTCPPCRGCGKCYTSSVLFGEDGAAFGGNFWPLNLLHAGANPISIPPERTDGSGAGT